jgi:hypothetical protein
MSQPQVSCGACRWEYYEGLWYVIDDMCEGTCVCGKNPETDQPLRKGDRIPDAAFREMLKVASGGQADVIPQNLSLVDGTSFIKDCEQH